ncbi:MAG TPA: cbb3-type cytochrome c oxidase subunit I [Bryobacteraceae bacterium]|nr:hypothetical protein [Bryobacterales bacterium]HRJ19628.1 cbb3-type cytochrome c oxidase subunit I [Bryobacteraceae bacterium]
MTPAVAQPLPEGLPGDRLSRIQIDRSCRQTVVWYMVSAVAWLLAGSLLALLASIKMHTPGFLADADWLTFGRVRPAHLSTMIYGWGSMAGVGVLLWLQARLSRVRLPLPLLLPVTVVIWNLAVLYGTVRILQGASTGIEWLEFPVEVLAFIGFCMAVIIVASVLMFVRRQVKHTYVSQWYLFGAVLWFPFLYILGVVLSEAGDVRGVAKAAANWWFAHNVLGLWFTPIGLATAYYMIPKVIGRPVHSYHLSLLGFWTLAIFYNWAGTHHLIGGPLPAWLVTVGIVGSMMMFIPVITVAVNHHLTMAGNFHHLRTSPTLRFVVVAAMSYTVVSFQGSLTALRAVNEVSHFTHYTIAHAHLGVYAFFTMMMFGAAYYILPRLMNTEWHSARWIRVHFWATSLGMALYWLGLTWAGWRQGEMMNDPNIPFLAIVEYTKPWLHSRSLAGVLMTIGHVSFAWLVWNLVRQRGAALIGPTLLKRRKSA